jgi:L-2-hydroxyglutarate oxidase
MKPWSATVIGGGILGTSVAYWLSHQYDDRIAVLEKEPQVAQHSSRRNTGITHRPFYLDPLKQHVFARSAQTAYLMWKVYAKQRHLPWNPVGTFEVAIQEAQVARLETYYRWGQENGMTPSELQLLTPDQVEQYEPHVRCHGAIWSKTDTAVDYGRFTNSLRGDAEGQGVKFIMSSQVKAIRIHGDLLDIDLVDGTEPIKTRFLINCAGGRSIHIAHMVDVGRNYTDLNFRGEYWRISEDQAHLANRCIYTVPRHPEFPFLDPHWIIRTDGHREIGPNAVPVAGPYTYSGFFKNPFQLIKKIMEPPMRNKLSLLFNPEFLNLSSEEWKCSLFKSVMAQRAQEFLPELKPEHLIMPGIAGIRSSLIDQNGTFIKEAIELPGPMSYHITNYNSPGATGAPAYAAWLVRKLQSRGYLDHLTPKRKQPRQLWDFNDVCDAIDIPPR